MDCSGGHWSARDMNTQTYLVGVLSFVFMITNLLGAAFTISRLRSKTTQVTGVTPVDRAPHMVRVSQIKNQT
jgi:hypothetical protein